MNQRRFFVRKALSCTEFFLLALALCALSWGAAAQPALAVSQAPAPRTAETQAPGQLFTPAQLVALLPEKVYFQGQSAPVQLRNAGGTRFPNGAVVFAALVDTAGYSTAVQQKYQFYLVTETGLRFGGKSLPPGAYGAGFVEADRFVVMDIGGHTVLEGSTSTDSALQHPRPLQIRAERPDAVRLYLGRRYVLLEAAGL